MTLSRNVSINLPWRDLKAMPASIKASSREPSV